MKISALIQSLSIATVVFVAGLPAYGASFYITTPEKQLDDDPILDIARRPGGTISWSGFIDTTGLTANLQSLTLLASFDSNEITGLDFKRTDENAQLFPSFSREISTDPNTDLTTIIGFISGPPGLPPNVNHKFNDITITLGSQLNNDGKSDFRFDILSAIDINGIDVTDQFRSIQEFEVQSVPEPLSVFGLVIAGGFGAFLRKQSRKVQY
ncbi:PEP-CTERM sorting domain-containing protein [Nostoc sp. UHCC 0702]|nr:PEP-CTERM sorting domain-containing protein [Nostoc sp. UHCC 0702]